VPWISESKTRDAAELAIGYVLILLAEWFPNSEVQRFLFWFTLAWVIVTTILARPTARTLGLRPSNARSLWIIPAIVILGALFVWMASQLHTLHGFSINTLMGRVRGYIVWSLLQQFMLQDYFLLRLLRLMPSKAAAVSTASLLFASAHIPNPVLMLGTLLWGIAACTLFLRYRDLYSLGVAHCLLGICIAVTVPAHIHHGMRVGLGYLQYRPRVERTHFSQMDQMVSTEAWVIADAVNRCSARQARP
jgi:membrane protease YdiL (CAAX protease family)